MVEVHTGQLETRVAGLGLLHSHEAAALAALRIRAGADFAGGPDVRADPVAGDGDRAGAVVADVADVVAPQLLGIRVPGDGLAVLVLLPFRAVAVVRADDPAVILGFE